MTYWRLMFEQIWSDGDGRIPAVVPVGWHQLQLRQKCALRSIGFLLSYCHKQFKLTESSFQPLLHLSFSIFYSLPSFLLSTSCFLQQQTTLRCESSNLFRKAPLHSQWSAQFQGRNCSVKHPFRFLLHASTQQLFQLLSRELSWPS